MKKVLLFGSIMTLNSLFAQNFDISVQIEDYSPQVFLKRNSDTGGYIQGIQTQLKDGTNNWFMGNFGTDTWVVSKGDWQGRKLVVTATGNVGIGTITPEAKLHIGDGSGAGVLIDSRFTSVSPKIGAQIFWSESSATRTAGDLVIAPRTDIDASVAFYTNNGTQIDERMVIKPNGFVGIGSKNPDAPLSVKGLIHATEVKVDLAVPADYVFQKYYTGTSTLKPEYNIPTLEDVEKFTKENNHLPNIPSAKEIQEKGLNVGEMSNLLLQKIEELTLYTIEQNKAIKEQNYIIKEQNQIIKEQQKRIERIEKLEKINNK
jgi:hypothetical protein